MCARWDADGFPKSVANPFHTTDSSKFYYLIHVYQYWLIDTLLGISEDEVLKQLGAEEEEAARITPGAALHSISPLTFLTLGLELEESQ